MFPPPGSYLPPSHSGTVLEAGVAPLPPPPPGLIPQKAADVNQVVQQMQGMKVDETNNRFSGPLPPLEGMNYNNTQGLPSSFGSHPSQNVYRAVSTTKVTYSPQPRATYPYSSQGSIGSNANLAPNSVPSTTIQSSSVGYMPKYNGTLNSAHTHAGGTNGVPNGDFSDPQLAQAHLHSSSSTSIPSALQKPNLNLQSEKPIKSSMEIAHNHPSAPCEQSSHGPSGVPSGQMPYRQSGGSVMFHSTVAPSSAVPHRFPGAPNTQTLYNPIGAQSMPTPYSHLGASSISTSQSLPVAAGGKTSTNSSGPVPLNPPGPPSGPVVYNSPGFPSGHALHNSFGSASGPMSHSSSAVSSGPASYNSLGVSSGLTPSNQPGLSAGLVTYSSSGIPCGPYNPPGASSGPAQYNQPGVPSGPAQYNQPGVPSGPAQYNQPGVPSGPAQYNPLGVPSGPTPYGVPGAPSGSVAHSPHGIPQVQPSFQQQQRKLDLDQMPSMVQVREEDKRNQSGYYSTDTKGIPPPLVTTNFIAQDRGVCSPRFMRSTMYCLPNSPDVLKQTGIPFAVVVSPMASICDGENEPPLSIHREEGPLRCKRCKAYMCSFMVFGEGGRCFQCAFCKVTTEVPQDYFCYLDGIGQRTDKFHRPELCLGSYEFPATKDYCKNGEKPNPPAYIFMLEVSKGTLGNGLVHLLCENMKTTLAALNKDEEKSTSAKVGFVTYNSVLHFYNLKKTLSQPHIMVMPDVHDAFVPLMDGFLVSVTEAEALIGSLMEQIPQMYTNEPSGEVLFGPVVQAGLEALKNANCAGKLLIFHSTLPTCDAPGKLQKRDGQKLLGTEKQKTVLTPQNPFYNKLAEDCVAAGCSVDLFLFPNDYIDVASLSPLCRHTGGHMYRYMYFQSAIDGNRFLEDLERNVTTPTAFDAVLRIRTSAGISPVFHYGNFFMSNATDIEISALNCHNAATVEFAYDEKLTENDIVYIQAALLYTTCDGDRRIRVHNLALSTSTSLADVYRSCELDTVVNFLSKQGLKQVLDQPPQQTKSALVSRTVKMLCVYRKHCSAASSSSQLILPEALKLLPVYTNCMLKSDALTGGPEILLDDRSFAMLTVNGMDVRSTVLYFYPVLISLHDLNLNSDEMPVPLRCSAEKLNNNGAYLLTNGMYLFMWISQGISPDWIHDVFGVKSPSAIDKQQASLMELDSPLSKRIRHIIEDLEELSMWFMRLNVILQGDKLEIVFRQFLVEDRGVDGSPSYVEFLLHLHKEISKVL